MARSRTRAPGSRCSSAGGTVALRPGVKTHTRRRQRIRRLEQTERLVIPERVVPHVDFRLRRETQSDVHARVDVGQGVEDVVDDAVGDGVAGDVFARRAHVADGREGAGEEGGVEE